MLCVLIWKIAQKIGSGPVYGFASLEILIIANCCQHGR